MRVLGYANSVGRIIRKKPRIFAENMVSVFNREKFKTFAKNQCTKGKSKVSQAIKTKDPVLIGTAIGMFSPVPGGFLIGGVLGKLIKNLIKMLKK